MKLNIESYDVTTNKIEHYTDYIDDTISTYNYIIELNSLKQWFDNVYQYKEQKLRRLHTLNKLTDENTNPYDELLLLYAEAETKRKRIQELETLIKKEEIKNVAR